VVDARVWFLSSCLNDGGGGGANRRGGREDEVGLLRWLGSVGGACCDATTVKLVAASRTPLSLFGERSTEKM